MLACMLNLLLFWKQNEGGQILEQFVNNAEKTESIYIPNFKMVYPTVFK
jgi:hypothetical protein